MNFIISASTDIGIRKDTNQDSLAMKVLDTPHGKVAFAVLCDGVGGLSKGELASATVVRAFMDWADKELPSLYEGGRIEDSQIKEQWQNIINRQNDKIMQYGERQGVELGTTMVGILLTASRYYVVNIGDSRAYELSTVLKQITEDHTVVAREIKSGILTEEQARTDIRRNVLLQCIGVSDNVAPEMFSGKTRENTVYMLCSDGFRNELRPEEIFTYLRPDRMCDRACMDRNAKYLIELNKSRQEVDNISVAMIRTC